MSRGSYGLRRAAKEHRCTEQTYHTIKPGDLYIRGDMPPEHEMNRSRKTDPGGRRWYTMRACLRCANEFALHTSDTRAALARAGEPVHQPERT
jgi:hypothetical protein